MKKKVEVDLKITPEEMAELFLDMSAEEQARFFNEAASICIKAAFAYRDADKDERSNMPWPMGLTSFSEQMRMVSPSLTRGGDLIRKKFAPRIQKSKSNRMFPKPTPNVL